jgi:hypothetical protein
LWDRTPPAELGLKFSGHALGFLIWLVSVKSADGPPGWMPPVRELTPADHLLSYLAYEALVGAQPAEHLRSHPAVQQNALCRLSYPEDFSEAPPQSLPDFASWTVGLGACMVEVLQARLTERCVELELRKGQTEKWQRMQAIGRAQESVLTAFLQAVDRDGRPDLARFLLRSASVILAEGVRPERWTGKLTSTGPRLADRAATYRAALALLHVLLVLREWTRRARAVGYFDEGYQASQIWKADWEQLQGDALCARAETVIAQLDPMRQT